MKCNSCESEINPKWKYAIDNNVCPFCGQSVIDEQLKILLYNMQELMDKLVEYPDQFNDWMLSNFNFIKIDSPNLINFVPEELIRSKPKKEEGKKYTVKVKTDNGEEEVLVEKTQSENKTNEFFKRAEAFKPNIDGFNSTIEKTKYLKNMAQQIKKAGTTNVITVSDVEDMEDNMEKDMGEDLNQETIDMQNSLSDNSVVSSLYNKNQNDEDEIPNVVLAMANKSKEQGSSNNANDLVKLQQMYDRVNNSRKNFESGESVGKGGFSRSG